MNIGIVTTWFERGAAYVSRQFKEVLESTHNVRIYARGGEATGKNDPNWDGPYVTWGKEMPDHLATVLDLKDFEQWLVGNKIELVIFNEQTSWTPVRFCNQLGIITGAYVDYYTEVTVPLFDCYDFLICNTKRHHSAFDWHPHAWYIPWGTDLDIFKPTIDLEAAISPTKSPTNGIRFFHSSGMSPRRKGTDLLVQAFAALEGPAHLIIHGQTSLYKNLPELAVTLDTLRQAHRLTMIEETVSAPGLYHLGDVYVYPTRLEGIGLTMAEALACGLPVITTDQPPMNEFVQPPENGQLVEVERLIARSDGYYWPQSLVNVDSLRRAMQFYLDHSDQINQYKTQARRYAEEHLNWRLNAQALLPHIANVKKRPTSETAAAEKYAAAYEPWHRRFFYKYPSLSRHTANLIRPLWRSLILKRRK